MTLHYVTRDDKSGNRLTTSYDTRVKADKFGAGENQKHWAGIKYYDPSSCEMTSKQTDYIVRSVIDVNNEEDYEGDFVIYTREKTDGDNWDATRHRYATYGIANTAMKAFVGVYRNMMIVEEPKQTAPAAQFDTGPAPF